MIPSWLYLNTSALVTNTKYQLKLWIYIFVIILLIYMVWRGTQSIWWTRPTGRKNSECSSNDINILATRRVKFELAAPTLMKSNRITAEEQDKEKIGKLCSERKTCRQKWLATLCLSGRGMWITCPHKKINRC